jgi:energy-coupling factor transporter transmembrane protein EcfT
MIAGFSVVSRGFLRNIHPLAKMACALLLFIFCIIIREVPQAMAYLLFMIGLLILSRMAEITFKMLFLAFPFAFLVGICNYCGWHSMESGILSGMRILFIGTSIVLFAYTTTPAELVRSLESVKLPRALTLGTLVSMRFLPVFIDEWTRIVQSMRLRGGPFHRNPYFYYRSLCVPMIYKIFTVSDTLTLSLYTRGFSIYGNRACFKEMPFKIIDGVFLGAFAAISLALAVL